jgi:two-component system cell cycle response regulator DivK
MATSKNKPTELIVLVDADADTRKMYTAFLRHHGFRVMPVMTGREALVVAARADAIVTETHLPGDLDGIELVTRLKRDKRTCDIPLVVVSSRAWDADRERAVRAGCDLFLSKPCLPQDLVQALRRLCIANVADKRVRLHSNPSAALRTSGARTLVGGTIPGRNTRSRRAADRSAVTPTRAPIRRQ